MDTLLLLLMIGIYGVIPLFCVVQILRIGSQMERDMDIIYDSFDKRLDIIQNSFERSMKIETEILDRIEGNTVDNPPSIEH